MEIIVILLAFLTLAALITGIVIMGKGGKTNRNLSNKLMIARVALQGVTIAVLLLVVFVLK